MNYYCLVIQQRKDVWRFEITFSRSQIMIVIVYCCLRFFETDSRQRQQMHEMNNRHAQTMRASNDRTTIASPIGVSSKMNINDRSNVVKFLFVTTKKFVIFYEERKQRLVKPKKNEKTKTKERKKAIQPP